jgi:hypothetical protein
MTQSSPVDLAVQALAAYRLTRLVIEDEITEPLRDKVVARFGPPSSSKISYLVHCPHCVSMYASAGIVMADMMAPRLARPVIRALALSAAVSLAYERR